MKKMFVKLLSILMAMLMLTACGSAAAPAEDQPAQDAPAVENVEVAETDAEKVVTVSAASAWEALNPYFTNHDTQIAFMYPMYDSWVDVTSSGEIVPRLFESWELSEDHMVVTAKIRQDSFWSDGEPVTAHDVVWTYKTWANPKMDLAVARQTVSFVGTDDAIGVWENEEDFGMKALDDYTVEMKLKKATTSELSFFYGQRYTFVLPKHVLENVPVESLLIDKFWEDPVTSGPFEMDSIVSGERIEYVANDDYYLGRPQMDRLIVRVVQSNQVLSSLMAGEVDVTSFGSQMSYSDYEMAKTQDQFNSYEASGFGNVHLLINNQNLDVYARKAIDMAINKQTIIDGIVYGYARPAISAIVPENPYRLAGIEGNAYDVEAAKELLAQSSLDTGRPLTVITGSSNTNGQNTIVLIQQMLAELGITINIETYDMATCSAKFFAGEYDLALMSSASNPFEPSESHWYFFDPSNWNCITDGSWSQIYKDAVAQTTFEDAKVYYDTLQKRLVDEVPMIFLYHPDILFISSQRISNVPFGDFALRAWSYWTWEVA